MSETFTHDTWIDLDGRLEKLVESLSKDRKLLSPDDEWAEWAELLHIVQSILTVLAPGPDDS